MHSSVRFALYVCFTAPTLIALAACSSAEAEPNDDDLDLAVVEQPWLSGTGVTRGHEDLTRFSVEFANALIEQQLSVGQFYAAVAEGDACFSTSHDLLKGNCRTDWPDDEMASHYDSSITGFSDDPDLQDLHFLRNYIVGEAASGRYACFLSRQRIIAATALGVEAWKQNDMQGALGWFGHATHTIQDSFAPPHCVRSGALFETLTDICTYGKQVQNVCFHSSPDLRDRIWLQTGQCTFTSARDWECLTPEAQRAAYATAGYLLVVASHLQPGATGDLASGLNAWFDQTPASQHAGYFRCDALSDDGYEPQGFGQDAGPEAGPDAQETPDAHQADATVGPSDDASETAEPVVDAAVGDDSAIDGADAAEVVQVEYLPAAEEDDSGCACATAPSSKRSMAPMMALVMGVVMGLRRRRKR